MTRLKLILITVLLGTSLLYSRTNYRADDVLGTWLTGNKGAKISIFKSGNFFYGKIAWLRQPNREDGTPKLDDKNPDAKLRSRHLLGLLLIKGFEFSEKEDQWINGEIYDPKNGKNLQL